jgi:MoaA/NifB/PqqE/SkfB family radical SAM enzyme
VKTTEVITCLEPLRNIYIARNGSVRVCCHNHHFEAGHLRNSSLLDIWRSPRRKEFAKRLYYGSPEPSCIDCNQPEEKKQIYPFSLRYKSNNKFPGSIDFELSNTCNLACIMCTPLYSSQLVKNYDNPDDLSYDFKDLPQQLLPFIPHLKNANFYGGEPFLIDIYYKIWDMILEINPACAIYFQTNGTVFNDRVEKLLEKGIFNIGVSIESLQKETFESIRKNADLDLVLANIDRFLDYSKKKKTFFGVSVCPIRNNWKELPEIIEYFSQRGIPIHFHLVSRPFNLTLWNLPKEEIQVIHDYLIQYKFNPVNSAYKNNIQKLFQLCEQLYKWHTEAIEREELLAERKPRETQELLSELVSTAMKFMDGLKWMNDDEREKKISIFSRKLNAIASSVAEKDILNRQFEKLLFAPVCILLNEIETTSEKEIKENILYL